MSDSVSNALKTQLRREHIRRRRALSQDEVSSCAQSLAITWQRFANDYFSPWLDATATRPRRCLALYAAVRGELPVSVIAQWATLHDISICYPRVISKTQMVFVHTTIETTWEVGEYGIQSPVGPALDPAAVAAVVLPGTAFDCEGHRLGMGGGFYDRWLDERLKTTPAPLCIGVGYDWQCVDVVPVAPHDITMDVFLSPKRWVDCQGVSSKG